MKTLMKYYCLLLSFLPFLSCKENNDSNIAMLRDGDIIFQTSTSAQSKAIQLATNSPYSHCGIIYKQEGKYFVYEAVQPVQITPLSKWISRGKNNNYIVKRLKKADSILTPPVLQHMKSVGKNFNNRDYDLYFEWSDERIYCSELVWKLYKQSTGLEVGKLQKLKDFDLSHSTVQQKMRERYGSTIPLNEKVISPAAIFESDLLYTVISK